MLYLPDALANNVQISKLVFTKKSNTVRLLYIAARLHFRTILFDPGPVDLVLKPQGHSSAVHTPSSTCVALGPYRMSVLRDQPGITDTPGQITFSHKIRSVRDNDIMGVPLGVFFNCPFIR